MKYKSLTYAIAMSVGVLTAPLALADLNDGLVAHYPFDGNAQDASGNGNHGKEYGGVQYADGMIGKSAKFDGDYIRIPQSDSLRGLNELTIAYWVKYYKPVSGSGNVSVTITNGPDSVSGDGFFTYAMSSGIGHYLGRTGNSVATRVPLNAGEPLSQQEFVFAVFSADANTIRSYKNGQMVDEKNRENKSASGRPETDWFVGANGKDSSPYYLNGYIDDLRIYNRALSKDEIQALYYNGTCKHATYSPKKRTLTVPFVEMPVIDFFTGQSTGKMELWTSHFEKVLGTTNRFILKSKTVAQITNGSSSSCPATYAVETGTLNIPYIDVPTGIAVGNKEFENGVNVLKATMTWEPMSKSFIVQEVEKLSSDPKTFKSCADIKANNSSASDGLYEIDPDGTGGNQPFEVYCDMTIDDGGWTLIFRHDTSEGSFSGIDEAANVNQDNPGLSTKKYSILNQLDSFKRDGKFQFRINWPGFTKRNIWSQTSNPTEDVNVTGYQDLSVDSTSNYWGGLEFGNGSHGPTNSNSSYIDGSVNHTNWFYAIGSYIQWGNGIPAAAAVADSVQTVELWVK